MNNSAMVLTRGEAHDVSKCFVKVAATNAATKQRGRQVLNDRYQSSHDATSKMNAMNSRMNCLLQE